MSSQMGWPEGASAECGSDMPSASPTTCEVAAVPRNWQPPPGEAQARHRPSAASSSVIWPWAKRAPTDCTLPASSPSSAQQGDAAGNQHAGQIARAGQRHHHGGQALVAGGDADDAAARGQRADQAAEDARRRRCGRAGNRTSRWCPGCGRRRGRCNRPAKGTAPSALQFLGGGVHQQADFPVAGVVAERDGRAVGGANAAVGAEDEELLAAERGGVPAHAGVLAPAEEIAGGPLEQHLGSDGQGAGGTGGLAADVVDGGIGGVEDVAGVHRVTIAPARLLTRAALRNWTLRWPSFSKKRLISILAVHVDQALADGGDGASDLDFAVVLDVGWRCPFRVRVRRPSPFMKPILPVPSTRRRKLRGDRRR